MPRRAKRYGTDIERADLDPRKARYGGRASEADVWEREESLDDEDLDRDVQNRASDEVDQPDQDR